MKEKKGRRQRRRRDEDLILRGWERVVGACMLSEPDEAAEDSQSPRHRPRTSASQKITEKRDCRRQTSHAGPLDRGAATETEQTWKEKEDRG